jgi:S-formylglutathione hydrolase FrmB
MAFIDFNFFSNALGRQTAAYVLTPDGKGPFPVFYLLHGLSDNHTIWLRRTRIEQYVAGLPLIVVMPDGGRGFYTNAHAGFAYGKHIGEELPTIIENTFHAKTTGKARCVGGLSMGGYGALRTALGHPGRFVSATSHSGAVLADLQRRKDIGTPDEWMRIFGPVAKGTEHDLVSLAKRAKQLGKLPRLRIDCGTEDFLLQQNRELHASLTKLRVAHEYDEYPGSHNWDYWDLHVREAIAFHCKALGISRT